jgi:hypothetical protein
MSSGPVGLDCREYAYGCVLYQVVDGNNRAFSAQNAWLITKIQVFAGATPVQVSITDSGVLGVNTIAAGGCLTLEPNGAMRGQINVTDFGAGGGAFVVIEYWFQANQAGSPLIVDVVPP